MCLWLDFFLKVNQKKILTSTEVVQTNHPNHTEGTLKSSCIKAEVALQQDLPRPWEAWDSHNDDSCPPDDCPDCQNRHVG